MSLDDDTSGGASTYLSPGERNKCENKIKLLNPKTTIYMATIDSQSFLFIFFFVLFPFSFAFFSSLGACTQPECYSRGHIVPVRAL